MKSKLTKKEIVFFDGDGTIWYPKKTKYKEKPHWIYSLKGDHHDHNKHLEMVPTAFNTLKKLKKMGVIVVLLSSNPKPPKEANEIIQQRVRHFELENLFDEVYATRAHHASKGKFIIKILKKRKIVRSKALMVGDKYSWDYKSARDVGVNAVLIESDYSKDDIKSKRIKKTIKKIRDVFNYIN